MALPYIFIKYVLQYIVVVERMGLMWDQVSSSPGNRLFAVAFEKLNYSGKEEFASGECVREKRKTPNADQIARMHVPFLVCAGSMPLRRRLISPRRISWMTAAAVTPRAGRRGSRGGGNSSSVRGIGVILIETWLPLNLDEPFHCLCFSIVFLVDLDSATELLEFSSSFNVV
ncbi:MAG: hypothetical protein ABJL67_09430 [Sulfitobacter sp.]